MELLSTSSVVEQDFYEWVPILFDLKHVHKKIYMHKNPGEKERELN